MKRSSLILLFRPGTPILFSLFLMGLLFFSGCAVPGKPAIPSAPSVQESPGPGTLSWSAVRFRFSWPSDQAPRWPLDLLVADRVVEPVRQRHAADIRLWRFHRRAVRDAAGHQFSFLFYADAGVSRQVFSELEIDPLLDELRRAGIVEEVVFQETVGERPADVGAASDPTWTPELQEAWPHYIMGVSTLWLSLIKKAADQEPSPGPAIEEMISLYERVDEKIGLIWQEEGQHALLHHLNAIFGYRPMMIRKQMRF